MNAIAMFLPQVVTPSAGLGKSGAGNTTNGVTSFQDILTNEQVTGNELSLQANKGLKERLTSLIAGDISVSELELDEKSARMLNEILSLMTSFEEESVDLSRLSDGQLFDLKNMLKGFIDVFDEDSLDNDSIIASLNSQYMNHVAVEVNPVDYSMIKEQFEQLFTEVKAVLSQINSEQDVTKAAPKILELLHQWSALEKKDGNLNTLSTILSGTNNEGNRELQLWKDLVQVFGRREQIALKQTYNSEAKVTTQDITKWLGNSLANHMQTDRAGLQGMDFAPAAHMSRLEQYAIHINQSQGSQPASQQLVEQFQDVVKTSKFLAMPNGTNQLSITLNPNNLGEMIVRLTQIDGEMTVKIMVTTQMAKEMLESNINQLRNMFTPNQVVIEKQDLNTNQTSEQMKEQKEQQMSSQGEEQQNHREQGEQHQSDIDFATQFHELLMNEKV